MDIHLIVPPKFFLNSEMKKSKSYHQGNFKVPPGKRREEFIHWSQEHLKKIRTRRSTSFLPDGVILIFFRFKLIKNLSNGTIDIFLIVPPNYETKKFKIVSSGKL